MAWFRVDDHLYSHPKWLALPKGAKRRKRPHRRKAE